MGFAINTNNDALNTYRNLTTVQNSLSKSLEKLSSGLRINQAGDDAAGLTISTQLSSQVSGLQQASRNAQDGTSLVQTADGALTQAQSILGRLRDLAVQAGNDSNSAAARTAISSEATSLTAELARIGNSVNFNGQNLLDGSTTSFTFQVGADGNPQSQIGVDLSGANLVKVAGNLGVTASGFSLTTANARTEYNGGAVTFTSEVQDSAQTALSTTTAEVDISGVVSSTSSASDIARALNENANFNVAFRAVVNYDNNGAATGVGVVAKDGGVVSAEDSAGAITNGGATFGTISFATASDAQATINALDTQIAAVSAARAGIGAIENRFNNVVSTISTSVTNLTAAKSRITDVDMASEMVNYTRANVLSQAGTAMLAQANSLPQLALKLLG